MRRTEVLTMREPFEAMRIRYARIEDSAKGQREVLRSLKLLSIAGIQRFTESQIQGILSTIYLREGVRIPDDLDDLARKDFLKWDRSTAEVEPEHAYLQEVVPRPSGEEVVESLTALIKVFQEIRDFFGLFSLGFVLGQMDLYAEALTSNDEALKLRPDLPAPWFNRGNALFGLGRPEEALKSYDKALELRRDFPEAWSMRGRTLTQLGRDEEALDAYDRALKLGLDVEELSRTRRECLSKLAQLPRLAERTTLFARG
jgi:tetratricopeptide (TPR) repeat protein